jgi:hypothetical protein
LSKEMRWYIESATDLWWEQAAMIHDKKDASSPTVSSEAVLLTCIVDTNKNRDVAIVDIPNAFVQTVVEE